MRQTAIDPEVLTRRVRDLVHGGRLLAARPMMTALRKLAPPSPGLEELEARLLLGEGRLPEALETLDRSIAGAPGQTELILCRADARMRNNDARGAAQDAADAVVLEPANTQAKAILGIALIDLGQPLDAIACLNEAVIADPACVAYRQGLAEAQERAGDSVAAAATLDEGIRHAPRSVALRTAAIMTAMRRRCFAKAAELADAACVDGVADACVFGLLGHARSNLGQHEAAAEAYGEAARLAPEDPYVRHLVRAAGILPTALRAPAAYLEVLFDGYAERFETHLISLGYRAPGLIRACLLAHLPQLPGSDLPRPLEGAMLDLGCGTGLLGVVLSDLVIGPLVGVDLSGQMLREAAAKNLYQELIQGDLETILADASRSWPVILAADVFCYFGDLSATLAAAHARLLPGGLFIFTIEELPAGASWKLRSQGRYAHARAYVEQATTEAGFRILEITSQELRREADAPVAGLLVALQRATHDA